MFAKYLSDALLVVGFPWPNSITWIVVAVLGAGEVNGVGTSVLECDLEDDVLVLIVVGPGPFYAVVFTCKVEFLHVAQLVLGFDFELDDVTVDV